MAVPPLTDVRARELGHPGVGLDAEDRAASRWELPGSDAGPGPDVQHVDSGYRGNDPIHQSIGIGGRSVRRPSRMSRYLPVLMGLEGRAPSGGMAMRPP
jgi:hypothetical protein